MASYKQMCMEYMRREKIRYEDVREFVLKITYTGGNFSTIPIYIYFDEAQSRTYQVHSVPHLRSVSVVQLQSMVAQSLCGLLMA